MAQSTKFELVINAQTASILGLTLPASLLATWFAAFHVIQLVLVGLVALTVVLLADEFGAAGAWSMRLGMGVFLIFFSAYDAVAGIATGLAMRTARDLPAAQQAGVWETVKDWPGFELSVFTLGIVGTLGWVVALVLVVSAALWQKAQPMPVPMPVPTPRGPPLNRALGGKPTWPGSGSGFSNSSRP